MNLEDRMLVDLPSSIDVRPMVEGRRNAYAQMGLWVSTVAVVRTSGYFDHGHYWVVI